MLLIYLSFLLNNAGFIADKCVITEDGIEIQWSVNYFSPCLLTRLIFNENMMSNGSRIINVSASAHAWDKELEYDFACSTNYSGRSVYSKTKLAINMFSFYLAGLLKGKGTTVNCLHPGVIRTQFKAHLLIPPAVFLNIFSQLREKGQKPAFFLPLIIL